MKRVYIYLGIALVACLNSCTDDSLDNGVKNPVHTGDEILFGSTLSDNANMIETRTVYGDRTDTGVPVYWEDDGSDEIAIFCLQSSQPADHLVKYKVMPETDDLNNDGKPDKHQAASVTKVNTAEAGLQWGDPDTEHRFYAFYPASAVKGSAEENESGKITANIPVTQQVQEWRKGTFSSNDTEFNDKTCYFGLPNMDYAYMYAYNAVTPSKVEDGSLIDLHFKNLVTVLDITIQGPESGDGVVITNVNVDAIDGHDDVILTGDFTCDIRAARNEDDGTHEVTATCTPIPSDAVRNRISIPCYAKNQENDVNKGFITLKPGELMNVKAYIIPQDVNNTVTKQTLRVSVATLNGAPCRKTLSTADVTPHKINRVILPKLVSTGTNYWLSNLDPDIYFSELSIPGSFQAAATEGEGSYDGYQGKSLEQQFKDGVRFFSFQSAFPAVGLPGDDLYLYYAGTINDGLFGTHSTIDDVVNELKEYITAANGAEDNKNTYKNEFAVVELRFKENGSHLTWDQYTEWMKLISKKVQAFGDDVLVVSNDMTIKDLAGKVAFIIKYNGSHDSDMAGAINDGTNYKASYMNIIDEGTGIQSSPVYWGNPNFTSTGITAYTYDVTFVARNQGENGNATLAEKTQQVQNLFTQSVNNYSNESLSRNTWYIHNLGGFYNPNGSGRGGTTTAYTNDINTAIVDYLQGRTINAALGIVMMNYADKQSDSGAKYKSDWLIQTVIDNNFKFELRKKPSTATTNYNAAYNRGGNAIGWDE